jgi:hypothetical protein
MMFMTCSASRSAIGAAHAGQEWFSTRTWHSSHSDRREIKVALQQTLRHLRVRSCCGHARRAQMCKSQKGQFMRNDMGTSKSWKCVQGWQAPHEAIQKLSIDMRNYVCNVLGIMIMLMATFGQAVLGLCKRARRCHSAC